MNIERRERSKVNTSLEEKEEDSKKKDVVNLVKGFT